MYIIIIIYNNFECVCITLQTSMNSIAFHELLGLCIYFGQGHNPVAFGLDWRSWSGNLCESENVRFATETDCHRSVPGCATSYRYTTPVTVPVNVSHKSNYVSPAGKLWLCSNSFVEWIRYPCSFILTAILQLLVIYYMCVNVLLYTWEGELYGTHTLKTNR